MRRHDGWFLAGVLGSVLVVGCADPVQEEEGPGPWEERPRNNGAANQGEGNNGEANNANPGEGNNAAQVEGRELYGRLCASCHGEEGRGLSGPPLRGWASGREALVGVIDATMPLGTPERCEGACAEAVADYILAAFGEEPVEEVCTGPLEAGPRQLRLLTRREYAATVRDLLQRPAASCGSAAECDLRTEVCEGGLCTSLPCNVKTFWLDPQGQPWGSVHVAGEFNGWAATVGGGGWAMQYDAGLGLWVTQREVVAGTYQYKFVVNDGQQWLQDPANPEGAPDGFGGQNSVVHVDCSPTSGGGALAGLTAGFPFESRPEGFAFDNNSGAGLVTATHIEEYLAAAEALADEVVSSDALLPCGRRDASESCARRFVEGFGGRAFRRPLEAAEIERLAALVRGAEDAEEGYRIAATVILTSPSFLYRSELGEPQGDGTYRLSAWEVASLLSYTFWGTMPDEALVTAAASGELDAVEGIEVQARRLLGDPRAADTIGTFAVQWLGVEKILTTNKSPALFPGFDAATRQAMAEETRRFVSHVVFGSTGRYDELLLADYTFANERTAPLYGMSGVRGAALQRVPWTPGRAGLLGQASVLGSYAHSDQSSPILRGLFVRRNLLCQDLGTPPPNAGGVPEVDPNATTRERFRQHTDDAFCAGCHRFIDGVGFGFERFDALGQARAEENGQPIDDSGNMNDVEGLHTGTDAPFTGVVELAQLLADSRAGEDCFARQYLRFVQGRVEGDADRCTVEALQRAFADADGDIIALMIAITQLDSFTLRKD